jgi:hypothetical protein
LIADVAPLILADLALIFAADAVRRRALGRAGAPAQAELFLFGLGADLALALLAFVLSPALVALVLAVFALVAFAFVILAIAVLALAFALVAFGLRENGQAGRGKGAGQEAADGFAPARSASEPYDEFIELSIVHGVLPPRSAN